MRILDYIFYRIYIKMKNNKEAPLATASLIITGFLLGTFPIVWYGLPYLLFGWDPTSKYVRILEYLIIYLFIYLLWYKPREYDIIKRYKYSKYNKKVSYGTILFILFIVNIIALCLQLPLHAWIENNHYDGIVLRWLLRLFE